MFIFHFKKVLTIHRLNVFSILKLQKHSFWHKLKTRLGALLLLKLFSPAITDGLRQEPLIFSVSGARNLLASLCNIMWIFSWLIQQDVWKKNKKSPPLQKKWRPWICEQRMDYIELLDLMKGVVLFNYDKSFDSLISLHKRSVKNIQKYS